MQQWHTHIFDPLCRIGDAELEDDPAANLLTSASEEAQKVARNEGKVRLIATLPVNREACMQACHLRRYTTCEVLFDDNFPNWDTFSRWQACMRLSVALNQYRFKPKPP